MLKGIMRRQEMRQLRSDERELARVSQRGRDARAQGLPCSAPMGYEVACTLDLAGAWAAGWEDADRELEGNAAPSRRPEQGADGAGESPPHPISRDSRARSIRDPEPRRGWTADPFAVTDSRPTRHAAKVAHQGR